MAIFLCASILKKNNNLEEHITILQNKQNCFMIVVKGEKPCFSSFC